MVCQTQAPAELAWHLLLGEASKSKLQLCRIASGSCNAFMMQSLNVTLHLRLQFEPHFAMPASNQSLTCAPFVGLSG
jgi:hypothetical protein